MSSDFAGKLDAAEHWRMRWQESERELALIKRAEPASDDAAEAMKEWLKTFGFKVFCELKHGDIGFVLSLLQEGDISRGKAAEAIAELLVGSEPQLPKLQGNTFGEDDFPSGTVAKLRAREERLRKALERCKYPRIRHDADAEVGLFHCSTDCLACQINAALAETAEAGKGGE